MLHCFIARTLTRNNPAPAPAPAHLRRMSLSASGARLTDKTVLITGASSGIGLATAFEFARTAPDIKLILAARRIATLKQMAAALEEESKGRTKVLPVRLDVSDPKEVAAFVDGLPKEWRDIDVLINNAYDFSPGVCGERGLRLMCLTVAAGWSRVWIKLARSRRRTSTS